MKMQKDNNVDDALEEELWRHVGYTTKSKNILVEATRVGRDKEVQMVQESSAYKVAPLEQVIHRTSGKWISSRWGGFIKDPGE